MASPRHATLRLQAGLALALAAAAAASAGTITGTLTAKGPAVRASSGAGAYASHRYSLAERIDYAHLEDFIVYIDGPVGGGALPAATAQIVQHNVGFEPHVLPILVGTTVLWPNQDSIFHNVFSMSETKEFDLGLYTQERVPRILFDQVGRVDVYCSIHSKMHCIIWVLPNRYFAKSDARGNYVIRDVPPGTYRLKAWQEKMPPARAREITVPAEGETRVNFVLSFDDLPRS